MKNWKTSAESILTTGPVVPVIVVKKLEHAVPMAKALVAGGVRVLEVTLRTECAVDAIRAIAKEVPEAIVGAGTVLNLEAEKRCLDHGAKFIVSPGFSAEMADYSAKNNIPYLPGCVTPTEIMRAMEYGIKIVKFFPANVYGGLKGMKALAAPFVGLKFMPTGGVNADNAAEFLSADFIHAVGGSWICPKADVTAGNYEKITALCEQAVAAAMGFRVAHVGINNADAACAGAVAAQFEKAFGFAAKEGNSSIFASSGVEVMKTPFRGEMGHIAVTTCNVERAIAYLRSKGFETDPESIKYKNGKMIAA